MLAESPTDFLACTRYKYIFHAVSKVRAFFASRYRLFNLRCLDCGSGCSRQTLAVHECRRHELRVFV